MKEVKNIELNNPEVLEILNGWSDFIQEGFKSGELPSLNVTEPDHTRDRWLADDYMHRIIDRGEAHNGFPESMRSYSGIQPDSYIPREGKEKLDKIQLELWEKYRDKVAEFNEEMMTTISAKRNALAGIYPPGGWIGWHNNANAHGYNILFTWSETGDGWFDYWDLEKQERVRIQDVPGWQAKMTYFGPYDDPDKLCYHAAYTDCYRITVAFVFDEADEFWEEVIEDLETPC